MLLILFLVVAILVVAKRLESGKLNQVWTLHLIGVVGISSIIANFFIPSPVLDGIFLIAGGISFIIFYHFNYYFFGLLILGLGILSNGLVVTLNGGMPVSKQGMIACCGRVFGLESGYNYMDNTMLPWLSDWVYIPYLTSGIASPGDLLMLTGLIIVTIKELFASYNLKRG
ncbi:MAG: hypothetical protein A3B91_01500 [Candidatus Yanofskybacteria bacterium RIFCSPHIGHO2_02_FULL_41_29]|nr:MAG: hypothetical protein A3B91_01500 [Candidatus Yanofskybacteria bacterium RIFCSPHIGHO2_02_FULL_41_29]OGN18479.1 MAG: hypothetical protein A3F48_02675 [Candidatus Yanofskybacteria bacterium RIFCSPHIGHO2_12_FULL_41_9]OGN21963.1 MAG: hypothetical protein A2916_02945 [Candidatus Yanofskybacteria bacterium RIFCSPLOWO2_01_FULL_41_67]